MSFDLHRPPFAGRKLPEKWIKVLTNTPETGMGYHVVNIKTKDGRIFKRTVMNCEQLIEDINYPCGQSIKDEDIKDVMI